VDAEHARDLHHLEDLLCGRPVADRVLDVQPEALDVQFFPEGLAGLVRRLIRRLPLPAATPGIASTATSHEHLALAPAQRGTDLAIHCNQVSFGYIKGLNVVRDVSLSVRGGTIHGLIGPNGSGKSTLVSLIAGQRRPDAGTITINGTDLSRQGPHTRPRHGLTRTFQTAVLVKELTTAANVAVGLYSRVPHIAVRSAKNLQTQATPALAQIGLGDWAAKKIAEVPHGVEQLTQLAAAAVSGSGVLVLDEPLAGLAPSEVDHVAGILRGFREQGGTVIVIEHQVRFVFDVCDEVTVLSAGSVVASGPAAKVRQDAKVREVYLGQ
jgi:branched-chain amino acid transport system permease protein